MKSMTLRLSSVVTVLGIQLLSVAAMSRHSGHHDQHMFDRPVQAHCSVVASKFQQDLRACWARKAQGCIAHFTRKDVMTDYDFHNCKQDLYVTCVKTCYSVWGFNDNGCNNGCARIGKYLN